MRTLYLDADACPVTREALSCARRARVPVVIVGNTGYFEVWDAKRCDEADEDVDLDLLFH